MAREHTTQFVSEEIKAVTGTANTRSMGSGEPGLPAAFVWHDRTLAITTVLASWREKGTCTHGPGESYLHKHWFEVELETGEQAKHSFERNPRAKARKPRWYLFSIAEPTS